MKFNRTLTTSILLFILVAGMIIGLSSCSLFCRHDWKDATCTAPKTCSRCNKTEGNALGHTGGTATCTQKAVCTTCNAEYGELASHAYTQELVKAEAFKSEATCTSAAVYYKSCACGAISTNAGDVFFDGNTRRHTYTNNVCTVCGLDGNNPYYLNFLSSITNDESISIVLNNFVVEVDSTGSAYDMTFEKFNTVNVAELELSIKDGELSGAAHGEFNFSIPNAADTPIDFKAILTDGYLYIDIQGIQNKIAIEELLNQYMGQIGATGGVTEESSVNMLAFVTTAIVPMVETFYEDNKASINDLLGYVLNMFFTFENQADGSVLVTLSKDKILALNETLANKPVAQVIDIYFGTGTFDEMVDLVFEILDLKICDIPTYLTDNGIDYDDLVAKIEELLPLLGVSEEVDIDDLLKNSEVSDYAIGMLLFGTEDDSYKAEIEENGITPLREKSVYTLADAPEDLADQVKDAVSQILDSVSLTFNTKADGDCTALHVNVNKLEISGSDDSFDNSPIVYLTLSLDVIANGKINVTWGNLVDEIENALLPIPEEAKGAAFTAESDEYGWTKRVYFRNSIYNCTYYCVDVYEKDFETVISTSITPDDGNWLYYNIQILQNEYYYHYYVCEENGELHMFISNPYTAEFVKIEEISGGYHVIYENGTEEDIFLARENTTELTISKLTALVLDDLVYNMGFDHVDFYYNPVTGQYSLNNPTIPNP